MSNASPPDLKPSDGAGNQLVGTTVSGRYKVESLLGTGGMGSVYLVQHTHMRKRFALKILNAKTAQLPEMVARFEREAMAAAHVEHPNITAAIDFGKAEDGSFFLVLEYLEGKSLREAMAATPFDLRRAMHIARQVASALERSHELGIIHRDLKPEKQRRGKPPSYLPGRSWESPRFSLESCTHEPRPPALLLCHRRDRQPAARR